MSPEQIAAIRDRAVSYAQANGPGGEKAWWAGLLANDVPAMLAEIEQLQIRMAAAETVCTIYGWTSGGVDSEREKATHQAWSDWCQVVGGPVKRSPLWDERIRDLAARRDEIRAATLAKIRGEHPIAAEPGQPRAYAVPLTDLIGIAPDERTGRTRCPLCNTLPIGHEGDCEP